jgi:signal peptidase I
VAATVIGIVFGLARWRPSRIEIRGSSMSPALEPGDWALALATRRLRRRMIVVVEHPRRPGFELVKRIVAGPGGTAPDGSTLESDRVWIEGDASEASTDSRSFGPIEADLVKARVRLVYWPPERWRPL